jgi:hypothetical protein
LLEQLLIRQLFPGMFPTWHRHPEVTKTRSLDGVIGCCSQQPPSPRAVPLLSGPRLGQKLTLAISARGYSRRSRNIYDMSVIEPISDLPMRRCEFPNRRDSNSGIGASNHEISALARMTCAWILAVTSPLPCLAAMTDAAWSVAACSFWGSLASISLRSGVP